MSKTTALTIVFLFYRCKVKFFRSIFATATSRGGEMVDTRDLKSLGPKRPCGFDSRPRHAEIQLLDNQVVGFSFLPNSCLFQRNVSLMLP